MKAIDQTKYQRRLWKLIPDEAIRLFSGGWVSLAVREPHPEQPSAVAWTLWDKDNRRFEICFTEELMNNNDDETVRVVMKHELGHIALGHFQIEPCGYDTVIATDISVNWYLRKHKDIIHKLDGIDAEETLAAIGLAQQPYPTQILHEILHEQMHQDHDCGDGNCDGGDSSGVFGDGNGQCAGIQGTEDARAVAASIMTDKAMQKEGEFTSLGLRAGTHGGGTLGLPYQNNLPKWLPAMEEFARATVDVVLAERRSHKRPQPALAGYGVHAPSQRPTWAQEPALVCLLVDTSGSMWDELKYVQPVLEYLARNKIEVRLIAGDVRVTYDEVVTTVPTDIGGGGGTEIVPLFERATEYDVKSMVVFSDAYLSQTPKDPGVPCLWVGAQTETPGWAQRA